MYQHADDVFAWAVEPKGFEYEYDCDPCDDDTHNRNYITADRNYNYESNPDNDEDNNRDSYLVSYH